MVVCSMFSCDTEDAPDCLQSTGDLVTREIQVGQFSRILVHPDIELIVAMGAEHKVVLKAGENLTSEIQVTIEGDRLVLINENGCNLFRKYATTKAYVTTPTLTEIRSASQNTVSSLGILEFPELSLYSEDFTEASAITSGDFDLQIATNSFRIVSNNIATFYISGTTDDLNINFASGIGRFEGAALVAARVAIFHRGTNKIIVNPQQSLRGELRSTGDLISKNRPPTVEVEQFYKGQLVFE